jgi:prevent-host-death family protein
MKPLQVHEDIIPIGEFKTHAARIMRQLRDTGRPIVITQHGRPAGVLVPTEDFDRLTERARFVAAIQQGLADSEAGRVISDEELGAELDRKYGAVEEP